MFDSTNTQPRMSVPLRQCLVMSVLIGDSHCLPAGLFSADLVSRVVFGITGECPQRVFQSSATDNLLVFAPETDLSRVKVQLEQQSSWMGKPVHLQCVKPSGVDVRKFGVIGSVHSSVMAKGCQLGNGCKEGDVSLELPFFSGNSPPEGDEVTFAQWRYAVENAKFTSTPNALHSWIFRSLRNPAAQVARNQSLVQGPSLSESSGTASGSGPQMGGTKLQAEISPRESVTNISFILSVLLDTLQLATGATGLWSQGATAVVHGCSVRALDHNLGKELLSC